MARIRNVVGIDISKKTLDLALYLDFEYAESFKIDNTPEAILDFITHIKKLNCKISNTVLCAEETGIYGTFLKQFSVKHKWKISFESPLKVNRSIGVVKGKSDKKDAVLIGDYAIKNLANLNFYIPERKIISEQKYLDVALERLENARKQLLSSRKCYEEFNLLPFDQSYVLTLASIDKDIKNIKERISNLVLQDERLNHLYQIVTSVPGIGDKIFRSIIIYTNEFKSFDCPQKFASYCTIAPFRDTSGTSLDRRGRNSNMGNRKLKPLLHLSVLTALRTKNSHFYHYYMRRKNAGYQGLKLINALRNKIIRTIFACVRDQRQYEPADKF